MSASTSTSTSALPTLRQSLCQLPSSVCTAGPQPGTKPAQCAPLDLNLGPSQLSVHRWTSTWDLPSSVCTAGPQRPDRIPEDMPDRVLEDMSDRMPEDVPEHIAEDMPGRMPEDMPEDMPDRMPEDMLDKMPEDMSDRMPEDLPVTKRINVMVGITRSKVTSALRGNIDWQCAIAKQAHLGWFPNQPLLSFPFLPVLSRPFPSFPFLFRSFPSFPFLSLSFPSFPFLSVPFPSFPFLSLPFPSCPFRSLPFPSFPFLSWMRSKGSRCPTIRNHSQPSARLLYGRASGKFSRRGNFCVSRGRRGTSWHSDVFCNVSKVILCGRRNTFATFSDDALQFSWQAQHFGRVHRHFAWQAQHFRRVVLRVFYESHWQGCVKWRQGADSVADVAFCEMCWKLTEASHETSILR